MARLYTKKVWLNDQTKLSAKNLNHIEKGIEAVADAVDAVENQLETFKDKVVIGEFNDNKENTLFKPEELITNKFVKIFEGKIRDYTAIC